MQANNQYDTGQRWNISALDTWSWGKSIWIIIKLYQTRDKASLFAGNPTSQCLFPEGSQKSAIGEWPFIGQISEWLVEWISWEIVGNSSWEICTEGPFPTFFRWENMDIFTERRKTWPETWPGQLVKAESFGWLVPSLEAPQILVESTRMKLRNYW
jgi:hypothetical protein